MENKINDNYASTLLFFCIASATGIFLLSISFFHVPLLLIISCTIFIFISFYFNLNFNFRNIRLFSLTSLVLLLGILLRLGTFPHFTGGQDQGLYANFAQIMLESNGLFYVDLFRQSLPEQLKAVYDSAPSVGTILLEASTSKCTIPFYPLHPMWMAVFGSILGPYLQSTSLLIFSVLYLYGGGLLSQEIFRSARNKILAMLLLAINPALVFFSKFPVSETVALAFSINGILFLIKAYKNNSQKCKNFYYLIAILCFNSLFYTRFAFLAFLPFSICLVAWCIITNKNRTGSEILFVTSAILSLFFLSQIWYYYLQKDLFTSVFTSLLPHVFSKKIISLIVFVLSSIFIFLVLHRLYKQKLILLFKKILFFSLAIYLLSFFISLFSIFKIYKYGSLSPYPFPLLDTSDPFIFRYNILYRFIQIISPFAFLTFFLGFFYKIRFSKQGNLFVLLAASIWLVNTLRSESPYLYYYSRYICSEIVPFGLIILSGVITGLAKTKARRWTFFLIATIASYNLYFTFSNLGHQESEIGRPFENIKTILKNDDIIYTDGIPDIITTPLKLFGKYNILRLNDAHILPFNKDKFFEMLVELANKKRVRLIKMSTREELDEYYIKIGEMEYIYSYLTNGENVRDNIIQAGKDNLQKFFLPINIHFHKIKIFFYDLTGKKLLRETFFGHDSPELDFQNWHSPENNHRWSKQHSFIIFSFETTAEINLDVVIRCWTFGMQRCNIFLNDRLVYSEKTSGKNEIIKIILPKNFLKIGANKLEFNLPDANKPQNDTRTLGLAFEGMTFRAR